MSEELREQPETAAEAAQAEKEFSEHARVRREKLAALQEAGADPYAITSYDVTAHCAEIRTNFDEMEGKTVRIAGRMMSKRVMGKASFCDVRDGSDRMQVYGKGDDIGTEEYQGFKKWDLGDIVGVEGMVFRTQKGEISIHAHSIQLLSKSLLPLPEKFHGTIWSSNK